MIIRQFETRDFPQAEAFSKPIYYPKLWETNDAYTVRMASFPEGCLVAEEDYELLGYCFSHPWNKDRIVALGEVVQLPANPNCYYIHDLAVHTEHRNKGVGKILAVRTLEIAEKHNFKHVKLVSVLDSHFFWQKLGFQIVDRIDYTPSVPGYIMERVK